MHIIIPTITACPICLFIESKSSALSTLCEAGSGPPRESALHILIWNGGRQRVVEVEVGHTSQWGVYRCRVYRARIADAEPLT